MVTHMVGVGEETGALDEMLDRIAEFYEEQVEASVKALTSILEPIMIIVIGAMVGFIVISMYLPLFEVYNRHRIMLGSTPPSRSSILRSRRDRCDPVASPAVTDLHATRRLARAAPAARLQPARGASLEGAHVGLVAARTRGGDDRL